MPTSNFAGMEPGSRSSTWLVVTIAGEYALGRQPRPSAPARFHRAGASVPAVAAARASRRASVSTRGFERDDLDAASALELRLEGINLDRLDYGASVAGGLARISQTM
jgi:hypothetical protein